MGLKIVQHYDGSFALTPEAQTALTQLLTSPAFLQQVSQQLQGKPVEFTGLLFQPVPYTPTATKGMPVEYEQYLDSPDHAVINVPPNFMVQAKIFQPSRLCAIYRRVQS